MGLYDDDDEVTNDHFEEERILYQNSTSFASSAHMPHSGWEAESDNCSVMTIADQIEYQRMIKEQQLQQQQEATWFNKNKKKKKKPRFEMRERFLLARRSYIFTAYFLFTIPLCLFLLIYAIVKRGRIEEVWYVCLEGLATVLLLFEFFFNMAVEGVRKMVKSVFSWLHLCAVFCCVVMFTILVIGLVLGKSARFWTLWSGAAYIEDVIVFIQCAINVVRIIVYVYQTRKRKSILGKRVMLDLPPIDITAQEASTLSETETSGLLANDYVNDNNNNNNNNYSKSETAGVVSPPSASSLSPSFCYPGASSCKKQQSLMLKEHCEALCKTEHRNMYCSSFDVSPRHHATKDVESVDGHEYEDDGDTTEYYQNDESTEHNQNAYDYNRAQIADI